MSKWQRSQVNSCVERVRRRGIACHRSTLSAATRLTAPRRRRAFSAASTLPPLHVHVHSTSSKNNKIKNFNLKHFPSRKYFQLYLCLFSFRSICSQMLWMKILKCAVERNEISQTRVFSYFTDAQHESLIIRISLELLPISIIFQVIQHSSANK